MSAVSWSVKDFRELGLDEFHDILKLRIDVFVVEQDCPYPELDDLDRPSVHVQGIQAGDLIAYARIIPPNGKDPKVHIGRVVTHQTHRGSGLGHELMSKTMLAALEKFPESDIVLAAQSHLTHYYGKHGFKPVDEEYQLDGIAHRNMIIERN